MGEREGGGGQKTPKGLIPKQKTTITTFRETENETGENHEIDKNTRRRISQKIISKIEIWTTSQRETSKQNERKKYKMNKCRYNKITVLIITEIGYDSIEN